MKFALKREGLLPLLLLITVFFQCTTPKKKTVVKKIDCTGVVVRQNYVRDNGTHGYYIGIYFNDLNDRDRKALLAYTKTHQQDLVNN